MTNKTLVTIYTSNGEKISGIYVGTPEDFERTFHQYKMHPHSKDFGINLLHGDGGFIRIPVNVLKESIHVVEPMTD